MFNDTYDVEFEENKEEFKITDSSTAVWAIDKIKEDTKEAEYFIESCNNEINRLKEKIKNKEDMLERKTSYLKFKLLEYMNMDDVPSKETKTQMSLTLPNGKIVNKFAKAEICDNDGNTGAKVKTNKDLIDFVGDDYIKTTKEVDWAKFKKTLNITEDGDVITNDGELVDCLTTTWTSPSIDVKFEDD